MFASEGAVYVDAEVDVAVAGIVDYNLMVGLIIELYVVMWIWMWMAMSMMMSGG